jgi:hypothetical protein
MIAWRQPVSFPWIVALTVVACFALAAQADEGPALQQHSAAACGEDTQCLKLWYAEYKDAIIQEVLFWREFEDDIAAHNENAAEADLGFAIRRHQYRHNHWDFYKGDRFEGVSDRELSTLINSCRVAIIDMKFMLLPVGDGRPLAKGDPRDYLDDIRACEQQFKLRKFSSHLRGS